MNGSLQGSPEAVHTTFTPSLEPVSCVGSRRKEKSRTSLARALG